MYVYTYTYDTHTSISWMCTNVIKGPSLGGAAHPKCTLAEGSRCVYFITVASSSANFVGAVMKTQHIQSRDITFLYTRCDSSKYMTWLMHTWVLVRILYSCDLIIGQVRGRCHVRHSTFTYETWHFHAWNVAYLCTVASSSAKFVGALVMNTSCPTRMKIRIHGALSSSWWVLSYETPLVQPWDMTPLLDVETWLVHIQFFMRMIYYCCLVLSQVRGRCQERHDAVSCGTWLLHIWDMTHSHEMMRHDSFTWNDECVS